MGGLLGEPLALPALKGGAPPKPIPGDWMRPGPGDGSRPPWSDPLEGQRGPGEAPREGGGFFKRGRTLVTCSSLVIQVLGFKSIWTRPPSSTLVTTAASQSLCELE